MSSRAIITAAYLFDWIAGDPEWFPHPVRLIGKYIDHGERLSRRPGQRSSTELVYGGALAATTIALSYLGTSYAIQWSYRRGRCFGVVTEVALAWTCLASRNLHDEATAVIDALEADDVVRARKRLARIVGRDTEHLDEQEICRAVIETIAESASDGIMAPLFYMALGGAPLAMAYKATNTLDSMIGHADENYFYFGKIAARLDDIANFLPSRLTALSIAATTTLIPKTSFSSALTTWNRDGGKHKSPNAGQPESSMAGALQVRLGGKNFYDGEPIEAPLIGEAFASPSIEHAKRAIRVVSIVSILGAVAVLLLRGRRR